MTEAPVMQLINVHRSFDTPAGPVHVLRGLDLRIQKGEFLVITGPSGSGKSTLLHLCALIDQPSSGKVFLDGSDISHLCDDDLARIRKHEIGIVFQRFCLLPHRSAFDNVMFRFRYIDDPPQNAADLARNRMRQAGILDIAERKARLLSSGEQQRVAIARAMVQQPKLLLADEPTGNLDSASSQAIMTCLQDLNRSGLTVVMVTHNEQLLPYASRHMVCRNGRLEPGDAA